jgi:hypothetical protein
METPTDNELQDAIEEEVNGSELVNLRAVEIRELAAIPEANTPLHKSTRRANSGYEHSLDQA